MQRLYKGSGTRIFEFGRFLIQVAGCNNLIGTKQIGRDF